MKYIFLLLILICLTGCGGDTVSSIDPEFLIGTWTGTSSATYPGPDDGPLTKEEPIRFEFADSTFLYFWLGEDGNESIQYGSGDYVVGDSTVTFSNVLLQGYDPPLELQGVFIFALIDSTLTLLQDPVQSWQTYHLVILEKGEG